MAAPKLTVIQGGTADTFSGSLIGTGVLDEDGQEYLKGRPGLPPTASPPGDGMRISLHMQLRLVEIGLGLLTAACALGFWFLLSRMDTRFDRLDDHTREVSKSVTDLTLSTSNSLGQILIRLPNDQSQGSAGQRPPQAVREGAGGRAGRPIHP